MIMGFPAFGIMGGMDNTLNMETVLQGVEQMPNTPEGGPQWRLATEAGPFKTKPGAQIASEVGDKADDWTGKRVRLTVAAERAVVGWELAEEQ